MIIKSKIKRIENNNNNLHIDNIHFVHDAYINKTKPFDNCTTTTIRNDPHICFFELGKNVAGNAYGLEEYQENI